MLASQNFKTAMIMSDGERGVTSIIPELEALGIEVDISGAGGHVARVERRIRVIKERLRSYVAYHLPFALSSVGIAMCILYCVSRLNTNQPEYRNGALVQERLSSGVRRMERETSDVLSAIKIALIRGKGKDH